MSTRISHVVATPVSIPFSRPELWALGEHRGMSTIVLELHTTSGLVGIGEVVPGGPGPGTLLAALQELAPLIEGRDPTHIEANVRHLHYTGGWYMFQRTGNLIIAGLEIAMWDILGKTLGQPVYKLFGGPVRDRIAYMYFLQRGHSLDELIDEAKDAVGRGFGTVYVKGGIDEEEDIELIARLRDAMGPRVRLRLDANEAWMPGTAVRMLRRLEPYDLEFVEQPVRMDDLDALARLRFASRVPIAANQSAWTGPRIVDVVQRRAADVIVTDPHQEGGLNAFRKAVGLCELAGLPVVHHAFSGLTIAMTASMHVLCSSPNCLLAHQAYAPGLMSHDVTTEMLDISTGTARIPDKPGIGVELDPDKFREAAKRFQEEGFYSMFEGTSAPAWVPMR